MEAFSYKWFVLFYFILSAGLTIQGLVWLFAPASVTQKTRRSFTSEKAPSAIIKVIRYLFLFNLVSFILSFFPLSWNHLVYSFWVFVMIFAVGRFLVNWTHFKTFWENREAGLERFFRRTGALLLMIGLATFVLLYYSV